MFPTPPPGLKEDIPDEAAYLFRHRCMAVRAPHIRLERLSEEDERLAALLDWGLLQPRAALTDEVAARCAAGETELAFLLAILLLGGPDAGIALRHLVAPAFMQPCVAALAWVDRTVARPAIQDLLAAAEPAARAVAIAAIGARRTAIADDVLERFADDPDPLLRARTFRTIGQLGRRMLMPRLLAARTEDDPECRFWAAWSAARMGETSTIGILADIARGTGRRADAALEMLLRRATVEQGNAWLSAFARNHPQRRRSLVRATGILGDPLYMPWLLACMEEPDLARLAGEAVAMVTGLDIAYLDLDRDAPEGFDAGPNDDAGDDTVELGEDEWLPWPDMRKVSDWWRSNSDRFAAGTAFFLGQPKQSADWLGALNDAFQRQRIAAAMELAIRQPDKPMFEARARGRRQRQQVVRAGGAVSSAGSSAPS